MPELPEVETVRRTLSALVTGKTIERVEVRLARIVRKPAEPEAFVRALEGRTIQRVERRGKFLKFVLDDLLLLSHLRMEGRYGVYEANEDVEKHTHVIFAFADGAELRYRDVRQFGTMDLFRPGEEDVEGPLRGLGPEPLSEQFTPAGFRGSLSGRTTKMKPLLLNQQCVVGLGNIYVDEALHRAGIHPERAAGSLGAGEAERLYEHIRGTLSEAVEAGGSSVKSYVNGQGEPGGFQYRLKAYDRQGEPCYTCGQPIVKYMLGGRGTHVCLRCQPLSP